ncbi:P-loop containing nucleoside triphosphate hydrolase protein [Boletus reticuloceps]|uniref:P-loop containing nucleoside triphosphate hydrolase protein n=1 Tax=Boletus reticuloceps TaxID=495285 RepID=A0A8I3A272_9AGAM|nr:P-loop containing nucleoside triphosphate hydrolase protein [Boletus reticuloceps]
MRCATQDQSLIISGQTGSGKSDTQCLAIKMLLELYTELHFTDKGHLCEIKSLDYYFECNWIAAVPSGEWNFHIFYYLMASASPEEHQHLHLADKTQYQYLGHNQDGSQVHWIVQLVAAILHLGNIEFTIDHSCDVDATVIWNVDVLGIVAKFLSLQPSAVETMLTYKTKLVKRELCTVFLNTDSASDNSDDLAKTLYSLLFTCCPNSLDQFCINFANEHLQNFVQKCIFESHIDEYWTEGISPFVPSVLYFGNAECVHLLQNKPGGLIHIMDDQAC